MPSEVRIAGMVIFSIFAAVFLAAGLWSAHKENTGPKADNGWVPVIIFSGVCCFLCLAGVAKLSGISFDG